MKRGALLLAAVVLAGCGASKDEPAAPAFTVVQEAHAEAKKAPPAGRYLTARVLKVTQLRATPGGRPIHWIGTRTEFDSPRVLSVTARRDGWLRVLASERPNGRAGWIREDRARLASTNFSIHVDRSARRLTLRRGGRARPLVLRRRRAAGHRDADRPLRGHRQAAPRRPGLALRLLPARALRPPDQAAPGLAGRRSPRDPRNAEPGDRRARPALRSAACAARPGGTCRPG